MKKTGIAIIGLTIAMTLVVAGCTPITQANAADAAAVVGLGSADSYNRGSSKSILARTIMENKDAIVAVEEKAGLDISTSFSASYGGGTVTFTYYSSAATFPASDQDSSFLATSYWSVAYKDVTVSHDGETYKLNGTVYMRFDFNITSFDFILTGDVKISGAISDTADIDVIFKASTSGYTFTGTVNDYKVSDSFTIS